MSSVRQPVAASAVDRLIAVVVLPTPPFWFATANLIMIILAFSARSDPPTARLRPISGPPHRCGFVPRGTQFALSTPAMPVHYPHFALWPQANRQIRCKKGGK